MRLFDSRASVVIRAFVYKQPARLGPMTGKQFRSMVLGIKQRKETAA